jgi:hypothetical protein
MSGFSQSKYLDQKEAVSRFSCSAPQNFSSRLLCLFIYNSLLSSDLLIVKSEASFCPKFTDFAPSTLTAYFESFYFEGVSFT